MIPQSGDHQERGGDGIVTAKPQQTEKILHRRHNAAHYTFASELTSDVNMTIVIFET